MPSISLQIHSQATHIITKNLASDILASCSALVLSYFALTLLALYDIIRPPFYTRASVFSLLDDGHCSDFCFSVVLRFSLHAHSDHPGAILPYLALLLRPLHRTSMLPKAFTKIREIYTI